MSNNVRRIEKLLVKYVNITRKKRGLKAVHEDYGLRFLARRHSNKMARAGKIWHGTNVHKAGQHVHTGFLESLFSVLFGFSSGGSGENCAMMPKGSVKGFRRAIRSDKDLALALHQSWMTSPGHKANILRSSFSRVGIGIARRGNKFYATQVFYG